MVLVINQETFDDAVRENISEFGMTTEEAIEDTTTQFEAQGVDLSNIIKNLMLTNTTEGTSVLGDAITHLEKMVQATALESKEKYVEKLSIIKAECDKGLPYKIFAGKQGAYKIILEAMLKEKQDTEVMKSCLNALISLMTKYPDLLDNLGIQTMMGIFDKSDDPEMLKLVLRWMKECCTAHELNRQHIFDAGILDHLKPLLLKDETLLIQDSLAVLRALVLDDDVRVEFGRAHDHARTIANNVLFAITGLISKFKTNELLIGDVLLTLSSLLVRTEFCKNVEDAGGLDAIKEAMINFQGKEKLIKQCFKVLKALSGNDEVKVHIVQKGLAPLIAVSLSNHKQSATTSSLGLACIAALSLRCPDNSKILFEANIPEVIVDCMKCHPEDANVQKNGSWAIRNMVSRSRYQNEKFLVLGVEDILKQNLKKFISHEYDTKSALRDLGCDVKLKEEWTGKGGLLTSQEKKN